MHIQASVVAAHPTTLFVKAEKFSDGLPESLLRLRPRRLTYETAYVSFAEEFILVNLASAGVGTAVHELHVYVYGPDVLGALAGFVATRSLSVEMVWTKTGCPCIPFQRALDAMPHLTHLSVPCLLPFVLLVPHMKRLQSLHANSNCMLSVPAIVAFGRLALTTFVAPICFEERSIEALVAAFPKLRTTRFDWHVAIAPNLLAITFPLLANLTDITLRTDQCADVASILTHVNPGLESLTLQSAYASFPFSKLSNR
jgi:hypothetical protein